MSAEGASVDILFLEGLEVPCRVGCTEAERAAPQSLRVDVRMECPSLRRAGETDDISATVDYRVSVEMIRAVQGEQYLLIERVAEVLAAVALRQPHVSAVQVTVRKRPPVQGLEIAGVQITRRRQP
jgi:dihydroneopterin aldolase